MRILLMRLRAPMMSFGSAAIDDVSPSGLWPTRSMLTGLLGCALGYHRQHVDELSRLQERIIYAARCDREPNRMVDLQTVRTGAEDMREAQWTPHGWAFTRDDQWLRDNPVMRRREYLMDGDYVVALGLRPSDEKPTVDDLARKLDFPEGVLSIGRRGCIPSCRICAGVVEAETLLGALKVSPDEKASSKSVLAIWPEAEGSGGRLVEKVEDRDWRNDIHVSRRRMREGRLALLEAS